MVRPLQRGDRYACADARCENGRDVITGVECRLCEVRISDRRAARTPREGLAGNADRTVSPRARKATGRLADCAEPSCRQPIPAASGPLCPGCLTDVQEAQEAMEEAAAQWEAEGSHTQKCAVEASREDAETARLRARIARQWGTPEELAAYGLGTDAR